MLLLRRQPDSRVRLSIFEGPRSNTAPYGLLPRQEQHDGVIGPQQVVRIEAVNVGMHPLDQHHFFGD